MIKSCIVWGNIRPKRTLSLLKGYTGLEQSWWWEVQQRNLQVPEDTPQKEKRRKSYNLRHCSREKRERGRERKKTLIKIRITYSPFSMSPNITATRTDIFLLQCHLNIIWHIPSQLRNSCSADDEVLLLGDPFIKASTESVNFSRSPSNKQTNKQIDWPITIYAWIQRVTHLKVQKIQKFDVCACHTVCEDGDGRWEGGDRHYEMSGYGVQFFSLQMPGERGGVKMDRWKLWWMKPTCTTSGSLALP